MVSITNFKILGDLDQEESDLIHVQSLVKDCQIPGWRAGWTRPSSVGKIKVKFVQFSWRNGPLVS